ncbi:hypothetical protein BOTBODRAFT_64210 [Botryobasidium botryosum FD-172 SS1]|uniref:Uncharacterized protein n=1 Tax=Botryobasidium botryosum (strain FD-172 SS1) TaxID=930990 RepID=A0A067N135_BOTB1|nr:hypothetical protein BOTBODRAFT_64210 [Botryobasidium botryosum FD-172 SS1]
MSAVYISGPNDLVVRLADAAIHEAFDKYGTITCKENPLSHTGSLSRTRLKRPRVPRLPPAVLLPPPPALLSPPLVHLPPPPVPRSCPPLPAPLLSRTTPQPAAQTAKPSRLRRLRILQATRFSGTVWTRRAWLPPPSRTCKGRSLRSPQRHRLGMAHPHTRRSLIIVFSTCRRSRPPRPASQRAVLCSGTARTILRLGAASSGTTATATTMTVLRDLWRVFNGRHAAGYKAATAPFSAPSPRRVTSPTRPIRPATSRSTSPTRAPHTATRSPRPRLSSCSSSSLRARSAGGSALAAGSLCWKTVRSAARRSGAASSLKARSLSIRRLAQTKATPRAFGWTSTRCTVPPGYLCKGPRTLAACILLHGVPSHYLFLSTTA